MVDFFEENPEISIAGATFVYVYSQSARRWRHPITGRFVSNSAVIDEMMRHMDAAIGNVQGLTGQLYDGAITLEQWELAVAAELKDAHLAQSMYAVGGQANMTAVEYGRVGGTLADEYGYLSGFAEDIAAGNVSRAQALARIKQYGRATQQSYWREYAHATQGNIYWRTHPAEHCGDCIDLEGNNPYTADTLPTYPGAGATQCRGNCNCTLERA